MTLLGMVTVTAFAFSTGRSGSSTTGCRTCHGANADATTTVAFTGPTTAHTGDALAITLTVSTSNAAHTAAGLDVSATGGTFTAGTTTKLLSGEITHTGPLAMTSSAAAFTFTWTAPATEGTFTLRAAGNAVNQNNASSGDGWNLAPNLVIKVDNDVDGDGFTFDTDCDDDDAAVHPGATEVCNGKDDDCDGGIDVGATDLVTWYDDVDSDGFGDDLTATVACEPSFGQIDVGGDCDDDDPAVNPGQIEVCDALDVDENCDGLADDASANGAIAFYTDLDHDGFGTGAPVVACDPPPDSATVDGDCNDADATVNPGAVEDCSQTVDLNCDGAVGDGDGDGDGFAACVDCNDNDAAVHPGASERCNGHDDNCDGSVDGNDSIDAPTWSIDNDGDGHGVGTTTVRACTAPAGFVGNADDCNDGDSTVHPGAAEIWYDGVDQDCDNNDDDQDLDGFPIGVDCVDTDPGAHPGATEVPYDGIDNDCQGGDLVDVDADGHPSSIAGGDDCDDSDATIHPGVDDPPCDGVDLDCDPGPDDPASCGSTPGDTAATGPTGGDTGADTVPTTDSPSGGDSTAKGCSCGSVDSQLGAAGWLLVAGALARRRRR